MTVKFTENWYPAHQLAKLGILAHSTRGLVGIAMEFGVWEGRSTFTIASALAPQMLYAVDTWRGNTGEGPEHPTITLLQQRDVRQQFLDNQAALGVTNLLIVQEDCNTWLAREIGTRMTACGVAPFVRFAHVDASHDYSSVLASLLLLQPQMVRGGVLCGDDFQNAPGVRQAVLEVCGAPQTLDNLWWVIAS